MWTSVRLSSRTSYCIQCTSICSRKIVHKGTLYSLTWLPCVQKVLYSEGPMFRRSYVQKIFVQKVLCSDGLIFRRSYVQKVLCSKIFAQKVLCSEGPICSREPIFRNICLEGSTITSIVHWMHYNTIPWQALYIGCLTIPYHDKHCTLLSFTKWDYLWEALYIARL